MITVKKGSIIRFMSSMQAYRVFSLKKIRPTVLLICAMVAGMILPGHSICYTQQLSHNQAQRQLLYPLQTGPNTSGKTDPSRLRLVTGIGAGMYAGSVSYMSFVWYRDKERVPFHFYNDGKAYLQMDKFGHAYAAYWQSTAAFEALRWAGVDKRRALLWGGPAGFVFQAPIEILDGMHEGYGFSWWDVVANGVGSVLFSMQQAVFDEQLVLMKFSYAPSRYPRYHHKLGENHFDRFFLDYNGHTYWFSANLKSITGIAFLPSWLQLAYGYSANGMILEFDNPATYRGEPFPHLDRYRQHLLSLDIDLSRIPAKRRWVRTVLKTVNTVKIPFPALEFTRSDGIQFRPLYF